MTFRSVPHLVLVDSVLTHLPLSPHGPLLQCAGCQHLTIANLTMRRHAAPPGARRAARQRPEERGSVAGGLRGRRAGPRWACMLLQYARAKGAKDHDGDGSSSGGNSTFAVQGSTLMRNKVVQAGTGQNAEGLCQLGMGAVVLTADDSWVLDPPPPAAAALAGQQPTVGPAAPQGQSFKQQTPAAVPPSAAGPLVPQPHSVFGVELRGVVAERNTGGSGALFALLDLRVVRGLTSYVSIAVGGQRRCAHTIAHYCCASSPCYSHPSFPHLACPHARTMHPSISHPGHMFGSDSVHTTRLQADTCSVSISRCSSDKARIGLRYTLVLSQPIRRRLSG